MQKLIGVLVWFRTKQCRLQSTIMVALGNKGHKQEIIGDMVGLSFAKYNNGCPWKQRPQARTNRGFGFVSENNVDCNIP